MPVPVRKAIFPVGGLGTRFLPATKSMPKEMLTVVDKPLIQYAVEEAREAGIEELIFITGRGKTAIEDHFDHAYELQDMLVARGKDEALRLVKETIPKPGATGVHPPAGAAGAGARGLVRTEFCRFRAGRCSARR